MLELTFVIVVIGILAAIALPRFSDTADTAYLAKAQSQLMAVRAALATERQKRILRGDTTAITSLSCTSGSCPATPANAFDHFSADGDGNYASVVNYPIEKCSSATQRACWDVGTSGGKRTYTFRFVQSSDGNDGKAEFILDNNRLSCHDSAADDCKRITR
jgi:type II secretory pathway pseudopilin PulG